MVTRFVCHDPDGTVVTCDQDNWLVHERRHPEIVGHQAWVQQTIEEPLAIYQSDTHANRKVFYRPYRFDPRVGQAWLRVVVAYNRNRLTRRPVGAFVTAFAVLAPKQSEVLLWPR